eukprot:gene20871-25064_t
MPPTNQKRDVVFPPGRQALYEKNRYSPAVGSRADGSPEPELDAQVRLAFDNLNAILHAARCTFDDVVDVTVFIVNPEAAFQRIWDIVQAEYWGAAPYPTVTAVGVTWLYGFQFEIKVVARLPD